MNALLQFLSDQQSVCFQDDQIKHRKLVVGNTGLVCFWSWQKSSGLGILTKINKWNLKREGNSGHYMKYSGSKMFEKIEEKNIQK